jgi:hypothetical protein
VRAGGRLVLRPFHTLLILSLSKDESPGNAPFAEALFFERLRRYPLLSDTPFDRLRVRQAW